MLTLTQGIAALGPTGHSFQHQAASGFYGDIRHRQVHLVGGGFGTQFQEHLGHRRLVGQCQWGCLGLKSGQ
jgi:hypothetical protein